MKYFTSILLIMIFFNLTYAQDSTNICSKEPVHGIQFQIDRLITLRNFHGLTFSYRYLLNKVSGLRIGFYTSLNKNDYDINQQKDTLFYNPPRENKSYSFTLSFAYIHKLTRWNDFSLILGGGPFISYRKYESNSESLGASSIPYVGVSESDEESIGYGLHIISGIEYNLSSNIILSGEFGLEIFNQNSDIENSITYNYFNETPTSFSKESGKRNSYGLRSMDVKLGISVFL